MCKDLNLLSMNPEEIGKIVSSLGLPSYSKNQILKWIYSKKVDSIDRMTDLSLESRKKLSEVCKLEIFKPTREFVSEDGTVKYIHTFAQGSVESVLIPSQGRNTLCISSQIGCKMNCKFCFTGQSGFRGDLSPSAILSQLFSLPRVDEVSNIVFMGMGEPLNNYSAVERVIEILTSSWGLGWSPKRITLSTIGVLPVLKNFLDYQKCHLAISLHNPIPEERQMMMPSEKVWSIRDIVNLVRNYDFSSQRRLSFEYTMILGYNDDKVHCDALIRLLKGLDCRVNLIRYHSTGGELTPSPDIIMENFKLRLEKAGITTTIRASRGEDIMAACGMLAGKS